MFKRLQRKMRCQDQTNYWINFRSYLDSWIKKETLWCPMTSCQYLWISILSLLNKKGKGSSNKMLMNVYRIWFKLLALLWTQRVLKGKPTICWIIYSEFRWKSNSQIPIMRTISQRRSSNIKTNWCAWLTINRLPSTIYQMESNWLWKGR